MRAVLDSAQQAEVIDLMMLGHSPAPESTTMPAPAVTPWQRVRDAAYWAVLNNELAIVKTEELDDEYRFHLRTLDDRPGVLIVMRRAAVLDAFAIVVRVKIGRFRDDRETARALQDSFIEQLDQFSRKPTIELPTRE